DGALHPKLVDFGIARVNDGKTLAMGIMGTPAYMAPELATGKGRLIGRETDLYAIGTMLYEFVSGTIPFDRETALAIMTAQLKADVPPLSVRPGIVVTDGLEAIE